MKLMLDLFFILHFTYLGVHMHPTPPPLLTGLELRFALCPTMHFFFMHGKKWSDQDAV